MKEKSCYQIIEKEINWQPPLIPEEIKQGDMPGDKISIGRDHIEKANRIFPELLKQLSKMPKKPPQGRVVITVCGGSGVGKSEIASLLSYYFMTMGIGSYTLSGDNYPRRFPVYNDAERLHIFRESALQEMINDGVYTEENFHIIQELQKKGEDADDKYVIRYPWFSSYLAGGVKGLKGYLGTPHEINFDALTNIVSAFKEGKNEIWLKRMGREESELWFEKVDFSEVNILIIEWTHGNSGFYKGVDIPVLLNSTPQETLAHRRARNRDGKTDSSFTMKVLELEQNMLREQASKAKIIVTKQGELIDYRAYQALMRAAEEQIRMEEKNK